MREDGKGEDVEMLFVDCRNAGKSSGWSRFADRGFARRRKKKESE